MDKKIILIASLMGAPLVALPILGVLLYVLLPTILSIMTGTPNACDVLYPQDGSALVSSLADLCNTARAFLGILTMLSIILWPFIAILIAIPATLDLFGSQMIGGEKTKWLAAVWLLPSFGSFLYYWFVKRKEVPAA